MKSRTINLMNLISEESAFFANNCESSNSYLHKEFFYYLFFNRAIYAPMLESRSLRNNIKGYAYVDDTKHTYSSGTPRRRRALRAVEVHIVESKIQPHPKTLPQRKFIGAIYPFLSERLEEPLTVFFERLASQGYLYTPAFYASHSIQKMYKKKAKYYKLLLNSSDRIAIIKQTKKHRLLHFGSSTLSATYLRLLPSLNLRFIETLRHEVHVSVGDESKIQIRRRAAHVVAVVNDAKHTSTSTESSRQLGKATTCASRRRTTTYALRCRSYVGRERGALQHPSTGDSNHVVPLSKQNLSNQGNKQKNNKNLLVSFSGGQDSVTLLVLLFGIQSQNLLKLNILFFHHLWHKDSFFVTRHIFKLSLLFKISIHNAVAITPVKTELQARQWRLKLSRRLESFYKYQKVIQAHSGTDKIETLLLNLFRGTGNISPFCSTNFSLNFSQTQKRKLSFGSMFPYA